MKLKTSFFNFTVFWKNVTRFAPLWVIYTVAGVFRLLQCLIYIFSPYYSIAEIAADSLQSFCFTNFIFGLISALLLFGDLQSPRRCNALHALPLRRETWFVTHFISGMCFHLVPNMAFAAVITVLCGQNWYFGPIWLVCMTLQYLFFFCLAIFAMVCTGKRFAATAVYFLINFLSYILLWLVESFYLPLMPGVILDTAPFQLLCPLEYLMVNNTIVYDQNPIYSITAITFRGFGECWLYQWVLGAVGLAFGALTLLLYRRRHLERAGDFVAVPAIRPLFSLVYTFSVAAIFYLCFGGMTLLMPLGLAIGYFTCQMLLQRKVNVFQKKTFFRYGLITGLALASLVLAWLDPMGIVRWTPKPENVVSITISDEYGFEPDSTYYNQMTLHDGDQVEELVAIHQELIRESRLTTLISRDSYSYSSPVVHLIYQLEDGTQVHRMYGYPESGDTATRLNAYLKSPEYIMGYKEWDRYIYSVTAVEVLEETLTGRDAWELLEAIRDDCLHHRVDGNSYTSEWITAIYIYQGEDSQVVHIHRSCTSTIAWLDEHFPQWDD